MGIAKGTGAFEHRDAMRLEQGADTVLQGLHDLVLAAFHRGIIDLRLTDLDAEALGMEDFLVDFRAGNQRLGGYAAAVQAGTPQPLAFNDRGFCTQLCRLDGRRLSAGPGSDNNDIKIHVFLLKNGDRSIGILWLPSQLKGDCNHFGAIPGTLFMIWHRDCYKKPVNGRLRLSAGDF